MTAPTPEQMRALADGGFGVGASQWHLDATFTLRAAADEVERLRKDKETLLATVRHAAEAYVERADAHDSAMKAATNAATVTINWQVVAVGLMNERDQLRAVIENAPHDSLCNYPLECRCWKAEAL